MPVARTRAAPFCRMREVAVHYGVRLDALARRHNEINREILEVLGSAKRSTSQSPASSSGATGQSRALEIKPEEVSPEPADALASAFTLLQLSSTPVSSGQAALAAAPAMPAGPPESGVPPLLSPLQRLRALLVEEQLLYSTIEYQIFRRILNPMQAAFRIKASARSLHLPSPNSLPTLHRPFHCRSRTRPAWRLELWCRS